MGSRPRGVAAPIPPPEITKTRIPGGPILLREPAWSAPLGEPESADSSGATNEIDDRDDHEDEDERAQTDVHVNQPFEMIGADCFRRSTRRLLPFPTVPRHLGPCQRQKALSHRTSRFDELDRGSDLARSGRRGEGHQNAGRVPHPSSSAWLLLPTVEQHRHRLRKATRPSDLMRGEFDSRL